MKKAHIAALALSMMCFSACQTQDPFETKVFETTPETVVTTIASTAGAETTTKQTEETKAPTEVATMELTVPFSEVEQTTEYYEDETEESTEEPTPQETRDPVAFKKRIPWGVYDLDVVYQDATSNYRIHFVIPQVYAKDKELFEKINKQLVTSTHCNFQTNYVLKDLDIEYIYEIKTETENIMSYLYYGDVKHLDTNEGQFFERDHTLHAFTVGRRTGKAYNLEEVYGLERAKADIAAGNYRIVAGKKKAFRDFTDAELAVMYSDFPAVPRDPDHSQDFYIQNGRAVLIIWVGNAYDNYVQIELLGALLPEEMQVETTEEPTEETLEETTEPALEEVSQ